MTAIIRYCTLYLVNKWDTFPMSFKLGNHVSLRYVLSWPTFPKLGNITDLVTCDLSYSEINRDFTITLDLPDIGLPIGVVFDNITPIIPPGVSSNIKTVPSSLNYISTEDRYYHWLWRTMNIATSISSKTT